MDISKKIAIIRATITNMMALVMPKLYIKLIVDKTGRGTEEDNYDELEKYCLQVFSDYQKMFADAYGNLIEHIKDKTIIEYGPGDFLGVALLFLCNGARKVYCIDRFPLRNDKKYINLYKRIIQNNSGGELNDVGWDETVDQRIKYISASNGLFLLEEKADIIISRAVLEHCNDLEKTFKNFYQNLKPNGIMVHEVDLTSHGMHLKKPLDFLSYLPITWSFMTCYKGYPNRWRKNKYKQLLKQYGFQLLHEMSRYEYSKEEVSEERALLAKVFRDLPEEDLRCSNYSFVAVKSVYD